MRKYLIAGLLVWVPLGVTVLVVKLLVDVMDRTMLLLPPEWRPDALFGWHVPGLGFVLSFVVVLATGIVVANLLGRRLVAVWEYLIDQIPLVRTIYNVAKQVVETLVSSSGQSFRKVILLEYPRRGMWTIGFQTASGLGEVQAKTGKEVIAVFVPTTPNPTSGFVLVVPREDALELDMSVDEALKMVISVGVAVPEWPRPAGGRRARRLTGDGATG